MLIIPMCKQSLYCGSFSSSELRSLSKALGYPQDFLLNALSINFCSSVSLQDICSILEEFPVKFIPPGPTHLRNSVWYTLVIKQALWLLLSRNVSFIDLRFMRLAFEFYELTDGSGLPYDSETIMKTLKVCRRVASPAKIMNRLKHYRSLLAIPDRLQLYEYFAIVSLTSHGNFTKGSQQQKNVIKYNEKASHDLGLYLIESDWIAMLSTQEQQFRNSLNKEYFKQERTFPIPKFSYRVEEALCGPASEISVLDQRTFQVTKARHSNTGLRQDIERSKSAVVRAKSGLPQTAIFSSHAYKKEKLTKSAFGVHDGISTPTSTSNNIDIFSKKLSRNTVAFSPSLVTSDDLRSTVSAMSRLECDSEIAGHKYSLYAKQDYEFCKPDARKNRAGHSCTVTPTSLPVYGPSNPQSRAKKSSFPNAGTTVGHLHRPYDNLCAAPTNVEPKPVRYRPVWFDPR